MLEEMIRSCQNPSVAEAAVRSIGSPFLDEVQAAARRHDAALGVFVAAVVRCFDRQATPPSRDALRAAMRRTDQPVLAGLRAMLAQVVGEERQAAVRRPEGARIAQAAVMSCCA